MLQCFCTVVAVNAIILTLYKTILKHIITPSLVGILTPFYYIKIFIFYIKVEKPNNIDNFDILI